MATEDIFYLGYTASLQFNLYTNTLIERPQELATLRLSGSGPLTPAMVGLGISPVVGLSEFYTSLEQGVIDGFGHTPGSMVSFHMQEVTKYKIDPPILKGSAVNAINLDSWNRIPKHLQDLMLEASLDTETWEQEYWETRAKEAYQIMADAGVETITFSPEDTQWYLDAVSSGVQDDFEKRVSLETFAKFQELLLK